MNELNQYLSSFLIAFGLAGIILGSIKLFYDKAFEEGYKQGQIDALTGKVKYELSKNEDGELVWTEINIKKIKIK